MKVTCVILTVLLTLNFEKCTCFSIKAPQATAATNKRSVRIITPSNEKDSTDNTITFDSACVANPVIVPPRSDKENDKWQCYYYGNSGSWNKNHKSFLPTGSSGLAESDDGLNSWTKIAGAEKDGAILAPSDEPNTWDNVHTGVGDVIRINNDELHMYYFGGNEEELPLLGPTSKIAGFRIRIGRAKSYDNGKSWIKDESYLLDYDESEGVFASWPRIVIPQQKDEKEEKEKEPWKMYYHSFNGQKWRVYGAESYNQGDSWTRTGLVLEGDTTNEDAFDYNGIGTRDVVPWRGGYLMIYEGVDKNSVHRLGAAFCKDSDEVSGGNAKWTKLNNGQPILEPGKGPLGTWTSLVVGTPYVVSLPDGSLRIYYCATENEDDKMCIGVVVSESGDISPESWKAV